jgi:hypothetical protein
MAVAVIVCRGDTTMAMTMPHPTPCHKWTAFLDRIYHKQYISTFVLAIYLYCQRRQRNTISSDNRAIEFKTQTYNKINGIRQSFG